MTAGVTSTGRSGAQALIGSRRRLVIAGLAVGFLRERPARADPAAARLVPPAARGASRATGAVRPGRLDRLRARPQPAVARAEPGACVGLAEIGRASCR